MSEDKLLVVGSRADTAWDYDQLERIAYQARLRGLELVGLHSGDVVAYGGDALFDELVVADVDDAAACVRAVARRDDICAVLTIRERSVAGAAAIARARGLRGNDPAAVERIRNKDRCRDWLRDHGFPQPASRLCHSRAQAVAFMRETAGPWIVKPRDSMASIGVTMVRAIDGLDAALGKLNAGRPFLVETFVDGEEINVEGVMLDGRANVLSLARKTPYERGGFITHRLRQPAGLSHDDTTAVSDEVARAVECAGVTAGHICVEAWLTGAGVVLGEIHARSGGGFCHLLVEQTHPGTSMFGLLIDDLLGRASAPPAQPVGATGVTFLRFPVGTITAIDGWKTICDDDRVVACDLQVGVGDTVVARFGAYDRPAVVVVADATLHDVEAVTAELASQLIVTVV